MFFFAENCLLHLPDSCGCATQAQNNYTRSVAAHLLDFGIGLVETDTKVSMDIGRRMGFCRNFRSLNLSLRHEVSRLIVWHAVNRM